MIPSSRTILLAIATAVSPTSFGAAFFKISKIVDKGHTVPLPSQGLLYPFSYKEDTFYISASDRNTLYFLTAATVVSLLTFLGIQTLWPSEGGRGHSVNKPIFLASIVLFAGIYYLALF